MNEVAERTELNREKNSRAIRRAIDILESTEPPWVLERSGMDKVIASAKARHGSNPKKERTL